MVMPLALMYLGGDGGFFAGVQKLFTNAPEGYFNLTTASQTPIFFLGYIYNVFVGYNTGWQLAQRYYSVPDERDTKKMAMLCSLLSLVGPLLWIVPTMVSRQLFPNINELWPQFAEPAEVSFVSLALLILPHGMIGLVVSAILAATMGQANDGFNWLAAVLTKDVLVPLRKRFGKPELTDKFQLWFAKAVILAIGAIAIGVALYVGKYGQGAFQFSLAFASYYGPTMSVPVMFGLIYLRTPWWSAIASSAVGMVAVWILTLTGITADVSGETRYGINTLFGVGVSLIVLFGSKRLPNKKQKDIERLSAFQRDLASPAYAEHQEFDPSGFSAYGVVGKIAVSLGVTLIVFALVPGLSDSASGTINLVAGLLTGGIGGILIFATKSKKRNQIYQS
jgi:Na+/proline symporter